MGASLRYAKVIDLQRFTELGQAVRPSLEMGVRLEADPPAEAAPFVVLRAWDHADGAFTETWRIADPHGHTVRDPVEREILPEHEELADEIIDQRFDYADEGYQLILEIDGREVARADFPVLAP